MYSPRGERPCFGNITLVKTMTKLDRYILKQIGVLSLLSLGAVSFLAAANEIRERVDEMPIEFAVSAAQGYYRQFLDQLSVQGSPRDPDAPGIVP